MPEFTSRLAEMKDVALDAQEADLKAFDTGGVSQVLTLSCYTLAFAALERYETWREQTLLAALDTLDDLEDDTGDERHTAWHNRMVAATAEAMKMIAAIAPSIPSIEVRALGLDVLLNAFELEEGSFFGRMATMPFAQFQGALRQHAITFQAERQRLLDKWENMGDEGRPVGEKAARTLDQVRRLWTETVEKLVAQDRDLLAKLRNVKIDPSKPIKGNALNVVTLLLQAGVQVMMSDLELYRRDSLAYRDELTRLFAAHQLVIIYFTGTREAVRGFLNNTNLPGALADFNKTHAAAEAIAATCVTNGQKADAARFVQLAKEKLAPVMQSFSDAYRNFVTDHSGLFVGAAELTRLNELLALSGTVATWQEAERVDIQSTLTELIEHTNGWEISVDGLSAEDRKELEVALASIAEPLSRGIVAANNDRVVDQFKQLVGDSVKVMQEMVAKSLGGGQ